MHDRGLSLTAQFFSFKAHFAGGPGVETDGVADGTTKSRAAIADASPLRFKRDAGSLSDRISCFRRDLMFDQRRSRVIA